MISDEAVEAAAKAYREHKSVRSPGNAKNAMRAALEAAAPYMLAGAYDKGFRDGKDRYYTEPTNPYRSQA